MKIKSTFKFPINCTSGKTIERTTLTSTPIVVDGVASNLPPVEKGTTWLVNAVVFNSTDRKDFIMFDPEKTIRDENGATTQGGWLGRNEEKGNF